MKYACMLFICKNTLINPNAISILTLSECIFTNKLSLLTHVFPSASNTHTHTHTLAGSQTCSRRGGYFALYLCSVDFLHQQKVSEPCPKEEIAFTTADGSLTKMNSYVGELLLHSDSLL